MELCDFALIVLRNVGVEEADCSVDIGLGLFQVAVLKSWDKRKWRV